MFSLATLVPRESGFRMTPQLAAYPTFFVQELFMIKEQLKEPNTIILQMVEVNIKDIMQNVDKPLK